MVMQWPGERASPLSSSAISQSPIRPARLSSQYFHMSVPEPRTSPRQWPGSIGPGGHEDGRQVDAGGAHQQRGRGLVAAAHQHRAVHRIGPQQFLGLHREQVAVEHRGRLLEGLGERGDRELQREAAGLPHPALDGLRTVAQVDVAGVDVRPGVEDRDDRLAEVLLGQVAELPGAGPVAEGAQSPAIRCRTTGGCCSSGVRGLFVGSHHPALQRWRRPRRGRPRAATLLGGRTSRRHRPSEARASLTTVTLLAELSAARSSSKRRICSQTFMAAG